ncbi:Uncharacterized protein ABC855_g1952 [[Candida] zeylanoides]
MSDLALEAAITRTLAECWDRISFGREYIPISQVWSLLEDFQSRLCASLASAAAKPVRSLLNGEEKSTLAQMSAASPGLRFYRGELEGFILKLVGAPSMLQFLTDRTQMNHFDLMHALGVERRTPRRGAGRPDQDYRPLSPPQSPALVAPSDGHAIEIARYRDKIAQLESQVSRLSQAAEPGENAALREFEAIDTAEHERLMRRLVEGVERSDALVASLRRRLAAARSEPRILPSRVPPIIRNYARRGYASWRALALAVVAVVSLTIVVVSALRCLLFVVVASMGPSSPAFDRYIYDTDVERTRPAIQWWKEIEWLERSIYQLQDWAS